jgi:5'-3' exonuclease
MGVPGLWPFLREFFPHAIKHFQSGYGAKVTQFDYVYLDANGLLHAAAQMIENYGDKKRKLNPYGHLSPEERRTRIFELFFDNIVEIVSMIRPKKVLYIAIDGPAPRAKQNQQRERRFIAAQSRKIEEELSGTDKFDSTSISPGTEFMHELSKFMYWKIRRYMQTENDWRGFKVIYSPPTVPGEGEHKILAYIRELSQHERDNATHCMFGPDGDLLMLTLSIHVKHMSLFREDQFEPGFVDLVNMGMIRRGLSMKLNQYDEVKRGIRSEHDVSNDFVFIGFFVGNDFLPKIKMFYKLHDGLKKMFEIYADIISTDHCYLTTNGKLNIDALQIFVTRLSEHEEEYIANQAIITAPDSRFIDHTLLKYSSVSYIGNANDAQNAIIKRINMNAYRAAYYQKIGVNIEEDQNDNTYRVDTLCEAYLHNLVWVYKYYTEGLPSWGDAYEYYYAPLMFDFARFIEKLTQSDIDRISTFEMQHPALPFEQLLAILSQHSSKLLPEEYRGLMTDENSSLVKEGYYPTKFEIDYEGKRKEHEGIAKLPFVDYNVVSKAYKEVAKKSKYVYHKNMTGKVCTFEFREKGYLSNFTSDYGNITDCRVKVICK